MLLDALDVVLVDAIARALGEPAEFGPFYAQIDRWLDTWYLTLEVIVARRWPETLLRGTAFLLFAWRLVGLVLFEISGVRALLVVFPNLFEDYFLYILIVRRFATRLVPRTIPQLILVLVVLYLPKAVQEWVLHWEEMHPWQWLRETFIEPVVGP